MRWQVLLTVAIAHTFAGVSAAPTERAFVTFADSNVQSVLDADYSQFSPTDNGAPLLGAAQTSKTLQDDDDEGSTGTGHLSQWSRQNKVTSS